MSTITDDTLRKIAEPSSTFTAMEQRLASELMSARMRLSRGAMDLTREMACEMAGTLAQKRED